MTVANHYCHSNAAPYKPGRGWECAICGRLLQAATSPKETFRTEILDNFAYEEWTRADQNAALDQGWGIMENSDHGPRIERYDVADRFDSDAAAVAYVGCQAILGDALAQKAFNVLAHFWLED